jgi:hypothetical protein
MHGLAGSVEATLRASGLPQPPPVDGEGITRYSFGIEAEGLVWQR